MSAEIWMAAAAVGAAGLYAIRKLGGKRLAPNEVKTRIAAGACVVDVRTPAEYQGGAYPGAVNIPLQVLPARLGEIPRDRPVVIYCASGARSAAAALLLRRAGCVEVIDAGGIGNLPR